MDNVLPLAKRVTSIKPSATARIFDHAANLQAQGVDLISFAVGEPDFDTPAHIREAAKAAIDKGASRYTKVRGIPELRHAICKDAADHRGGAIYSDQEVVVSVGAKHALFNLSQVLLEKGDEVIIPMPSYVSYPEQTKLCGATPVLVSCEENEDFLVTPEALERVISSKTKALILCSPSNPTGATYSEQQLSELAAVARGHDFWIIVDEIYSHLVYDDFRYCSMVQVAPDLRHRIIIVDGVSKTYAMTGWRIGWVLASERVAKACEVIQSQSTTNPTTVAQHAALAALSGSKQEVERMRSSYEERRNYIMDQIHRIDGLSCRKPQGAFYCFVNVTSVIGKKAADLQLDSDIDIANYLLDHAKIAVVPGTAFGAPGYIRLSYAVALERIEDGIERLGNALSRLRV